MLFISDTQYYVPVKLCRVAGSIHLFNLVGNLTSEHVTLKRNSILGALKLDWKEDRMTLYGNKINLPTSVIISLTEEFRIR